MTEQEKFYGIDFDKIKYESAGTLPYLLGIIKYSDKYEYFDKIKHILDIPEPSKSLEEIQKELDEKFEELLVKTKIKFASSQRSAEYNYNQKFKKIDNNFEYMKHWKYFPLITIASYTHDSCMITNPSSSAVKFTDLKIGSRDAGYFYTPGLKICVSKNQIQSFAFALRIFLDLSGNSSIEMTTSCF